MMQDCFIHLRKIVAYIRTEWGLMKAMNTFVSLNFFFMI